MTTTNPVWQQITEEAPAIIVNGVVGLFLSEKHLQMISEILGEPSFEDDGNPDHPH